MSETSGARSEVRAIVAGHGDFAMGMVSAVDAITGKGNIFRAISGRGLSASALEDVLRTTITESGVRVVFTDLQAGSCTMAARRVLRDRADVLFVCGVNLPMLLDFALSPEPLAQDAARHALDRGRSAIMSVGGDGTVGAPGTGSRTP